MYESITYAQLKSLPKEQKPVAWKELKTLYSTQKELAEKLGVSPAIVYNMVARYAKDESTGTKKGNKLKIADNPKKIGKKAKKQKVHENIIQENAAYENTIQGDIIREYTITDNTIPENLVRNSSVIGMEPAVSEIVEAKNDAFSITVKKLISGENAQFLLNGIGSTLLRNQNYSVEVNITEK